MLASSRNVTTDLAKDARAFVTAKTARDFLLELQHANVALGLVVVKRYVEIVHEREYFWLMLLQVVQQILGWTLLAPSSARRGRGCSRFRRRIRLQSLCNQAV